jgi:hypothetical protein
MRHAFIAAQLLWQAQAARDAEANQPRGQTGTSDHPSGTCWGGAPRPCWAWWPWPRW